MRLLIISFFLNFSFPIVDLHAQELGPPMQFGKIPDEDLKMTLYEADTAAAAVVLCDFGHTTVTYHPDGYKLRFEHHKRIKILKQSGFEHGNITIPFYSKNKREQFFFDKAEVRLPNGDKIKLSKKDIFEEAINEYWTMAKFTFPQLQEGCIIEYSYFINSESILDLREWYFQDEIPVRWSEYRLDFPYNLYYNYFFQGNEGMKRLEDQGDMAVYTGRNGTFKVGPRIFILKNAPAMKPEAYITTMSDYMARIRFQLSEFRYQDGRVEKVLADWKAVQKDLEFEPTFGEQFLKPGNYKKMVELLLPQVETMATQEEKANFFYQHLTQNVEWDGSNTMWTRLDKLDNIYASKKANSAELNLMLLALLKEAGITAYPVLTSTRSHGKMTEDYTIVDQFNYLLVLALPDGKRVLMDANDPLRPPGYPQTEALNNRGLMLKLGGTPNWMDIKAPKDGIDVFSGEMTLSEDGTLNGTFIGSYKGYNAVPERRHYIEDASGEHWKERLSGHFADVQIASVKTGNLENPAETFFDTLQLAIPNAAQVAGDLIYLLPVLYTAFKVNLFKQSERYFPVDFSYPISEQYVMKIKLPAGYKVEELPEPTIYALPNSGGSFRFAVEEKEPGVVQVVTSLRVFQLNFAPEEYPAIKELFDLAVQKAGEQIVLKKAS